MASSNVTSFSHSTFVLIGIPGLEAAHVWIAFPLCSIYIITLLGNATILFIIKTEPSLHAPMYIFLSILAVIDLLLSTSTMPKMLTLLWFDSTVISFNACLVQMFLIHSLSAIESTILLAMAFDRFVAICHPLRHASILTNPLTAKITLMAVIRGALFFVPFPLLIKRLPFCRKNVLTHSYCVQQDVMKLACGDITPNIVYGLIAILMVMGVDSLLIFLSYVLILRAVLKLASRERLKAFNTCVSHLCAVLIFYIPLIGLSVIHRFGNRLAPTAHIIMGNVYLFVPPVLNPIVYGAKTKQIRRRVLKVFQRSRDKSHYCF
ncbi:olfactory receptor 51E2-like [Rhinatrema bivittatum]|uniref:olfactory receptor 51E2-like n=1 Tax=Rhinatrema bivittatum TaxID=194408 RepID=UPI00112C6DDB|nr:olfactory receptor 51E2-like [Rhinatrema bivittatum]